MLHARRRSTAATPAAACALCRSTASIAGSTASFASTHSHNAHAQHNGGDAAALVGSQTLFLEHQLQHTHAGDDKQLGDLRVSVVWNSNSQAHTHQGNTWMCAPGTQDHVTVMDAQAVQFSRGRWRQGPGVLGHVTHTIPAGTNLIKANRVDQQRQVEGCDGGAGNQRKLGNVCACVCVCVGNGVA